ncbi:ADP-ribosylglycohydrolase family protein [Streptomyces anulatus]|uniref:ADP-ribosylglycohydrolase family protein n=1 Tax=Streptomyces TaxID=1883 RepID=UPI00067E1451|nr:MULTISPECIES: ADP-ribosylglycohydrolase family protein [Streptomyces]KND35712.1 crystallin [Streptomyces europaeiscabiei]MBT1102354.1 ADP-ribosylglycohydrolase family protein [Streptomyces sp. Tu10]MDF9803109.1 ADP-ribosylglycohydrolase [Streptomyces sp. HB372]WSC60811.1 ADP-ribosylglycohydrolase family protein [Streptomyces anulatus]
MNVRLTWAQPEDLVGHELRQAAQDGRDAREIEERWYAAGGAPAPDRAGASEPPAPPRLRALAGRLLDELALLESPLAADEPTGLDEIVAACPHWPGPADAGRAVGRDRLHAAWLGRAAGCLLGKPVEKLPLEGIRALARATGDWPPTTWFTARGVPAGLLAAHPWNRRSAATSLAENIDGMPEDDDLNYPLLTLLLLQRHGRSFTTDDLARLWLDELPAGRTFTAERIAYGNLLAGVEPPETARRRNPFREWIGAQIRADVHGWTHPGDPAGAAAQAHRDAVLTHTGNGVYGAMFTAAALAVAAGGESDVHGCLAAGLRVVPPHSRYARAVRLGIETARTEGEFDAVVDRLHAVYGDTHHWVHVLPNAALLAAALTHADGDFTRSIGLAVSGGWDTDSNGATAGSLAGLLAGGPGALPEHWTAPLKNRLATSVPGFDRAGFDTLAALTHQEALRP